MCSNFQGQSLPPRETGFVIDNNNIVNSLDYTLNSNHKPYTSLKRQLESRKCRFEIIWFTSRCMS